MSLAPFISDELSNLTEEPMHRIYIAYMLSATSITSGKAGGKPLARQSSSWGNLAWMAAAEFQHSGRVVIFLFELSRRSKRTFRSNNQ